MAGRGMGRGNLLELMQKKKQEEELRRKEEEEKEKMLEEQAKMPPPAPVLSKGRGSLLEKMRKSGSDSSTTASTTSSVTHTTTTSMGRSSLLGAITKRPGHDSSDCSGEQTGVLGKLSSLSLEETRSSEQSEPEVVSRQGESGKIVTLTANYIQVKVNKDKGMYQYEVKYSPDIDNRSLRYKLLNQHLNELGNVKTFDGALLYLPIQLPDPRTVFKSVHPVDNSTVTLTVIFKKKQLMKDNIAFFNTLLNRVMKALTLVKIGRQDFNPSLAHKIPQHRLEVWPGFVHAIHELEGGLLLNLDATHRVMRLDTVRDIMTDIYQKNPRDFKNAVINEVVGTSVLTRYNNRTYKVDDIDWDKTPMYKFMKGDEEMTLVDYYKTHHNIVIKDLKQPLLVHRSKEKKTTGETIERISLLIPELSFLAGITDSIRSDFRVTKDLAQVTKVAPEQRREIIRKFIEQVNGDTVTRKILSDWGLEIEGDTLPFSGRTLEPEEITFGGDYKCKSANADWGRAATSSKLLRTPNMMNWAIVVTQRNKKNCDDFTETLRAVCRRINMQIGQPLVSYLRDDSTENYVAELRKLVKNPLEMIVVILPTQRQDKYTAIKRICCVESPVPSQVIISKTISKPDKIKSVVEKIALQMNCKMGGSLWALKIPFTSAMVCGIDVYHAGTGSSSKGSVAAFVASLDRPLTTWHSRVCLQAPHQELIDLLKQCLTSALQVYRQRNGAYPDRIFIYRDGVGDGQFETVKNYEVRQFIETCSLLDPSYKPKMSVVIVQKRVNTRIFEKGKQLGNPAPGTIVDSHITRRFLYDFYLVPQLVRQGTVTPTHYVVLYDGADVKTDHMQRLTYKLCHLYYNWPGTIRVPAPCQYAHKLAYLVGQSLKTEPSHELNNLLYYL